MKDEMTDAEYGEACAEFESYLVEVLDQHDAPIEVKMEVISKLLAIGAKGLGFSRFQTINCFVSTVRDVFMENQDE